jgi:glucose-6-phosphate isomerase
MDFEALNEIAQSAQGRDILPLCDDCQRVQSFTVASAGILLDFSKQNITQSELSSICQLARQSELPTKTKQMFDGVAINNTENRAVLHTALRMSKESRAKINLEGVDEIASVEKQMQNIVADVLSGKMLSVTGERFTDVISIGIGGSFYGVKVVSAALANESSEGLKLHTLANIDADEVIGKLAVLKPERTLVVIISKTFTTQETMLNTNAVLDWLNESGSREVISKHCLAVTTNVEAATSLGILPEHILPMWDWVGGRFSVWSAVGLPLALSIGNESFERFKAGARAMDEHFQSAPYESNLPVLLALLGIWNRNGLNYPSLAILPYSHALRALPGYLQQTDMESNGKSVTYDGKAVAWQTAPIVFGQEGTNSQHAFMQLMHQGQDIIPTDFILVKQSATHEHQASQRALFANGLAQGEALMRGKTLDQAKQELSSLGAAPSQIDCLAVHKVMKGNTPSSSLVIDKLNPEAIGALLALYEHKIFVQGVLWQLNSFDQWGVELGKQIGKKIESVMSGQTSEELSESTQSLIRYFNQ